MKTINRFSMLLLATLMLGIMSCHKDDNTTGNVTFNNTQKVTASIYGLVEDESGNAVSGANVTLGGVSTVTNANGLFFFSNVNTSKRASTVVVSKASYFNGSRTLFVEANGKHTVRIMLMGKGTAQTFSAQSGGIVSFDGVSISFPANGIVNKATGVTYSGTVNVYAHKIDPTTDAGKLSMPGDLRGLATAGNENVLSSYGMFVAELYDVNGNALQIADGSEATITTDIPASLQGSAPSTIPLWYYDEAKGVWIEEGNAVMQNGKYVGTVKHFTYWNNDMGNTAIDLQVTFVDQNGNPLQGYYVTMTQVGQYCMIHGYTDNNGWAAGGAPANATLTMTVYPSDNSSCSNTPVYTQTVTTSSSNQDLGTIVVPISSAQTATINATIGCSGTPLLSNGVLWVEPMGIYLFPDASGNITYTFPCLPTTPITFVGYDPASGVSGESAPYSLVAGVNNIGMIDACANNTPFLSFTMTNNVTSVSETESSLPSDNLFIGDSTGTSGTTSISASIGGGSGTNGSSIELFVSGNSVGTFAVNSTYVSLSSSSLPDQQFTFVSTGSTTTFTSYPTTGFVEGNFTINFTGNTTGNAYTATGSFRISQ